MRCDHLSRVGQSISWICCFSSVSYSAFDQQQSFHHSIAEVVKQESMSSGSMPPGQPQMYMS